MYTFKGKIVVLRDTVNTSVNLLVREFVVQQQDKPTRQVRFICFNELTSHAALQEQAEISLDFMPKSSLKNGMYRTDLILIKINN
jgi:hypothetical protein